MGKWSNLKDTLPKFVDPDESQVERVNRFKQGFADKPCEHGRTAVLQHFEAEGKWWAEIDDGCVHETPIINTLDKRELARRRLNADRLKDKFQEKIKALNVALEAYTQLLLERLENEEETSFKLEDGLNTYVQDDVYVSVTDRAKLHQWVRDNKLDDLFTVNYQTLSSMVKNKIIDGEELPPGISTYFKSKIAQRLPKGES